MNTAIAVTYALWVVAGGDVNGGGHTGLRQPYIAAYFPTAEACMGVAVNAIKLGRSVQCIGGQYIIPGK